MRFLPGTSLAALAMLTLGSLVASGCAQVGELKARKAFKAANQAYQAQDYKKAATLYEETIEAAPESQQAHQAYFFLGNCYDNLWKPSKRGEGENECCEREPPHAGPTLSVGLTPATKPRPGASRARYSPGEKFTVASKLPPASIVARATARQRLPSKRWIATVAPGKSGRA